MEERYIGAVCRQQVRLIPCLAAYARLTVTVSQAFATARMHVSMSITRYRSCDWMLCRADASVTTDDASDKCYRRQSMVSDQLLSEAVTSSDDEECVMLL